MIWIAGLRGAMAYALALESKNELENGDILLIITLLYALITILFIGGILSPVLTKCDVKKRLGDESVDAASPFNFLNVAVENLRESGCWRCKKKLLEFDLDVFAPLFIKEEGM